MAIVPVVTTSTPSSCCTRVVTLEAIALAASLKVDWTEFAASPVVPASPVLREIVALTTTDPAESFNETSSLATPPPELSTITVFTVSTKLASSAAFAESFA